MGAKGNPALVAKAPKASVRELGRRANQLLKSLSPERLKFAVEFLEFLQEREEWEATWDILTDPKMMAMIRKAKADRKAGREEAFLSWEQVKHGQV